MTLATRSLVVVVALAVLSSAGQAVAEQPFRARISGHANPQPVPGDLCLLTNVESGTGRALHLGRLTWASTETVNFCLVPDQGVVTGKLTLTSANGDEIYVTYTTLVTLDPVAGTVAALGTYQLTGGTGRFTGISGTGELRANGSLAPPFEIAGSMIGTID
jgi:hypothetical protein